MEGNLWQVINHTREIYCASLRDFAQILLNIFDYFIDFSCIFGKLFIKTQFDKLESWERN